MEEIYHRETIFTKAKPKIEKVRKRFFSMSDKSIYEVMLNVCCVALELFSIYVAIASFMAGDLWMLGIIMVVQAVITGVVFYLVNWKGK
ncbi:MAG: hypothetical protein K6F84_03455, partial [Lachnospiraceae bacterium]|nr:hypothetical protein [Lachnospiraceae bacterium]